MDNLQLATSKPYHSLGRNLLIWFLLLALLPLALTAWPGYYQAVKGLTATATQGLQQAAYESSQSVRSWFNYRFMDLDSQSENQHNIEFLIALKRGLQASRKNLSDFVGSDTWNSRVDAQQQSFITLSRHYDYIDDLLLLDNDGNILFTVARKSDLGTNLFNGPYAETRFARSAKASLETDQALFSDLEHYAPSNNRITGFLTAPMHNKQGSQVGIYAIQLDIEQINNLIQKHINKSPLNHYLAGEDGLLRTPVNRSENNHVLAQQIDTEVFRHWRNELDKYGGDKLNTDDNPEAVFDYLSPAGQQVIGLHQTIDLPGVRWILISEIEKDKALSAAHRPALITLVIFILTGAIVTGLAIYQARRITRPIIQLANASTAAAKGQLGQPVAVESNDEIGVLTRAFNHMLMVHQAHEFALEQSSKKTNKALEDLAAQKFALDQHSIVAITDAQGTITFVNDKFTEISGYSRNELTGQNHRLLDSGHHDNAFFHNLYQTITSGKVWHGEICNKAKSGRIYWVDTTIVPFMGKNKKPESYISIHSDITTRKQTELELLEAKETAETATQQKI